MTVRKLLFTDIGKIYEIEKKSFEDAWTKQMLADATLADNFFGLVAEKEDGTLLGYLFSTYCLEEAEIDIVAVDKPYQRQGIATALLENLSQNLKPLGVEKIFLEVRRSNENAQLLYEKNGFKYIAVRPLYYGGKEDALIMSKIIKE